MLHLAISCLAAIVILMLPGWLAVRALGTRPVVATMLAPTVSIALYGVLGTAYALVGIPSGPLTLFAAPTALLAVVALICLRARGARREDAPAGAHARAVPGRAIPVAKRAFTVAGRDISWLTLAAIVAVAVGIITCCTVFLPSLGDPEAFSQNYDNAFHLSRVRTFMDTGVYSSLAGGFYPSAWHCLVALIGTSTAASVPLAVNASLVAIEGVAYPLSMVALLAALFPDRPKRVVLGALACTAIAYFPWRIMLFGPLYPNVLSFSLMPAVVGLFVVMVQRETERASRIRAAVLFVVGGVSLAIAQPNGVFSAGVFLIPFCLYAAGAYARAAWRGRAGVLVAIAAALAVGAAIAAIWVGLLHVPFFDAIVTYPRDTPLNVEDACRWALHFSYVIHRPQYMAGWLVVFGSLFLLLERRHRWIVFGYGLTALLFVISISVDGRLREVFTGFWYNDYHRMAAAASVFAIVPLAVALDYVVSAILFVFRKISHDAEGRITRPAGVVAGVLICAVLTFMYVLNSNPVSFLPDERRSYAYDAVMYEMRDMYGIGENGETGPLEQEERDFLDRVVDEVGTEAMIVNQPYDGSVFGYAIDDLNLLFKQYNPMDDEASTTVRLRGLAVAGSPSVQEAFEELDAAYVLQLDQGRGPADMNEDGSFYLNGYGKEGWCGINRIGDGTPGFTVVLSEGDMRLYRVEGVDVAPEDAA